MDLSVVIPLYNESESIEELNKWIFNTLNNDQSVLRLFILMMVVQMDHGI